MADDPIPKGHPCADCDHRDGEQCKWSDFAPATPRWVTWCSIDPNNPKDYAYCAANTSETNDDDEED